MQREVPMGYSMLSAALLMAAALAQNNAYADSGPTQAELNAAGQPPSGLFPTTITPGSGLSI